MIRFVSCEDSFNSACGVAPQVPAKVMHDAVAAAVQAERERCARIVSELAAHTPQKRGILTKINNGSY